LIKWLSILLSALLLAGCVSHEISGDTLGEIAADYVQMTLEIGEREEGYVDAYYGPDEWQQAAKAAPRSLKDLALEAQALSRRTESIDSAGLDDMSQRRRAFLLGQINAASTRLRMLEGERLSFTEEAEGLFGVAPDIRPLSEYDTVLARIERLVPGDGPLAERVDAFQDRFTIPKDRLEPVFRAAIDECLRRTSRHIALPAGESFRLEFVTEQPWSGYNWYKGNYESLIQINTDNPIRISRAVDLGCHEGYPGHHTLHSLMEQKLARERGWVEFTIVPLFSPMALISEGSANYGIELAFPGPERLEFETRSLYPLAGLSARNAPDYLALLEAMSELSGARFTIARDYLEGRIDREQAIELTQRYQLVSRKRAEQSVSFTDKYRSYVINYGLGLDMVRAHIESFGTDRAARWSALERLLSEPTRPQDLRR
jgi:hypothetical protein